MKNVRRDPIGVRLIQIRETGWLEKSEEEKRPTSKMGSVIHTAEVKGQGNNS